VSRCVGQGAIGPEFYSFASIIGNSGMRMTSKGPMENQTIRFAVSVDQKEGGNRNNHRLFQQDDSAPKKSPKPEEINKGPAAVILRRFSKED
jgi:hypothetical protein